MFLASSCSLPQYRTSHCAIGRINADGNETGPTDRPGGWMDGCSRCRCEIKEGVRVRPPVSVSVSYSMRHSSSSSSSLPPSLPRHRRHQHRRRNGMESGDGDGGTNCKAARVVSPRAMMERMDGRMDGWREKRGAFIFGSVLRGLTD